jgi:hypothetical protein
MDLVLSFHREFPTKPCPPHLQSRLGQPSPTDRGGDVRNR